MNGIVDTGCTNTANDVEPVKEVKPIQKEILLLGGLLLLLLFTSK